jgi:signal transduction histidine kinase
MRQVFANLLSNSMDAVRRGGRISIRIRSGSDWTQKDGKQRRGLRVTMADTGQGIPAELRQRMFEPFVSTKESTGTGLGLWVSEGIVRKHNGRIALRSRTEPPTGTVFGMFLPFDAGF